MKKEPLCYKLWAKILAYFLLTLFVGTLALSILGAAICWEVRAYTAEPYTLTMDQFRQEAVSYGDNMIQWLRDGEPRLAENLSARSNAAWRISDSDGKELFQDSRFEDLANTAYAFSLVYSWQEDKVPLGPPVEFAPGEEAAETEYHRDSVERAAAGGKPRSPTANTWPRCGSTRPYPCMTCTFGFFSAWGPSGVSATRSMPTGR